MKRKGKPCITFYTILPMGDSIFTSYSTLQLVSNCKQEMRFPRRWIDLDTKGACIVHASGGSRILDTSGLSTLNFYSSPK